jgi:hypothetical protein
VPSSSRWHNRNQRIAPPSVPLDGLAAGRVQARRAPKPRRLRR